MRARMLLWTADVEDDLVDLGSARIFVPSIMGAGILVSLGILLGDLRRVLAPQGGKVRRRRVARRHAAALVAPIADAIGVSVPARPAPRRRLRSRIFYLVVFAVSTGLSIYIGVGSTFNYLRDTGPFNHKVWMESLAISVSVAFFSLATLSLALALRYPLVPPWARRLVERSLLGVLEA